MTEDGLGSFKIIDVRVLCAPGASLGRTPPSINQLDAHRQGLASKTILRCANRPLT
jgi:hypothetical protein